MVLKRNPKSQGDYEMTNTAKLPTVTLNSKFKLGKKTFSIKDAMAHGVKIYDSLYLLQEDQLNLYRELGNIIIQIKTLFGGDKKAYGSFIASSDFNHDAISSADKYDAEWIAIHWTKVQKLNKLGKLNRLGVSSIRKIVLEAHPELRKKPKAEKPASAGNTSKGKPKASSETTMAGNEVTEIKNTVFQTVVAKNEVELAEQVFDQIQELGFNRTKFGKALAKLYTEASK